MATLPATGYIENASRTVSEMKTALEDVRDVASVQPGGAARTELTIATGTVTPATRDHGSNFSIDTESNAASDDLDIIAQTNMPDGSVIRVWGENASRVVTLKHANGGAGEMLMVDSADFALDATDKWVAFERRSTSWVEIARSYGAEGETANLTAVTTLDDADSLPLYDDSAGAPRRITVANAKTSFLATAGVIQIASGTVSAAAALDFADLSTDYSAYEMHFNGLLPVTDNVAFIARVSTDNGSTFELGASDYAWARNQSNEAGSNSPDGSAGDSEIGLLAAVGSGALEACSGRVIIHNPAGSGLTQFTWEIAYQSATPAFNVVQGGGQYQTATATDAVRFAFSSGNISAMNYSLFGWRA